MCCCSSRWVDGTLGDGEARLFGGWQRKIQRFVPAIIAIQPVAAIVPIVRSFNTPFSATPALVKQVQDQRFEEPWSTYPEAFVASAASGNVVYSPHQDRFERFSLWTDFRDVTPEASALRLAALVDNHHSLILFTNDDRVGSIISGLSEHIAVRQLASQPEGIVQDEANVAFLFQKVE